MSAYCAPSDVSTGNVPLPRKLGSESVVKQHYIEKAADDIDGKLGAIFELPLAYEEGSFEALWLKRVNKYLAIGQLVIDAAAGGEDTQLHAYGFHHLREANKALDDALAGKVFLSFNKREGDPSDSDTGPSILNKEPASYVDSFYQSQLQNNITNGPGLVYPQINRPI